MTLLTSSQVSDRCPMGYLYFIVTPLYPSLTFIELFMIYLRHIIDVSGDVSSPNDLRCANKRICRVLLFHCKVLLQND